MPYLPVSAKQSFINISTSLRNRKNIPVSKEFKIGPLDKWRRYRRFPCKLTLNIITCVLLTLIVYLYVQQDNRIVSDSRKALRYHFLPREHDKRDSGVFTKVDDLVTFLGESVGTFYQLREMYPGVYRNHSVYLAPQLQVSYRLALQPPTNRTAPKEYKLRCNLTMDNPLGPFTPVPFHIDAGCPGVEQMKYKTTEAILTFRFETRPVSPAAVSNLPQCFDWTVRQTYRFAWQSAGSLQVSISTFYADCSTRDPHDVAASGMATLTSLVCVLSCWDLALRFRAYKRWKRVAAYRLFAQAANLNIKPLTLSWFVFCVVTDTTNVLGSILNIYVLFWREGSAIRVFWTITLGFSCMLTWFELVSYLQYAGRFYLLLHTLIKALPRGISFLLGALPIYFAYALMGLVVFGRYSKFFTNIDISCVTLFCLLNGDSMDDNFISVYASNTSFTGWIFGRLFMYSYVSFFIFIVLNIFLVIIEEAYGMVQEELHERETAANNSAATTPAGHRTPGNIQSSFANTPVPYDYGAAAIHKYNSLGSLSQHELGTPPPRTTQISTMGRIYHTYDDISLSSSDSDGDEENPRRPLVKLGQSPTSKTVAAPSISNSSTGL